MLFRSYSSVRAGGRFVLGLGAGSGGGAAGLRPDSAAMRPLALTEEYTRIVRGALAGERVASEAFGIAGFKLGLSFSDQELRLLRGFARPLQRTFSGGDCLFPRGRLRSYRCFGVPARGGLCFCSSLASFSGFLISARRTRLRACGALAWQAPRTCRTR